MNILSNTYPPYRPAWRGNTYLSTSPNRAVVAPHAWRESRVPHLLQNVYRLVCSISFSRRPQEGHVELFRRPDAVLLHALLTPNVRVQVVKRARLRQRSIVAQCRASRCCSRQLRWCIGCAGVARGGRTCPAGRHPSIGNNHDIIPTIKHKSCHSVTYNAAMYVTPCRHL